MTRKVSRNGPDTPSAAVVQRLDTAALKAKARAAAAKRRVRGAKAAWKKARKAFKAAKKAAKQARQSAVAARRRQKDAVGLKSTPSTPTLPKSMPPKSTPSKRAATKSVHKAKAPPTHKARDAGAMPSAADVARAVIERFAAAKRRAPTAPKPTAVPQAEPQAAAAQAPAAPTTAPAAVDVPVAGAPVGETPPR